MVVIKENSDALRRELGKAYFDRLGDYADIIGYTLEQDDGETRVEFNPDRPDLFSFIALKESMKCFYDRNYWISGKYPKSGVHFEVTDAVLKKRPFVLAFTASGRNLGDRFDHLIDYQERLHSTVGKDRKKLSIGIHDMRDLKPPFRYDAVGSESLKFTTYDELVTGSPGEILAKHPKGIDFSDLIVDKSTVPIITDSDGDVLSMPPVINGLKSKVTDQTSEFFVDITGTDFNSVRSALFLLSYEMRNMGYRISLPTLSENVQPLMEKARKYDGRKIILERMEIEKMLGFSLNDGDSILVLRKMGYMAEISKSVIDVFVPGNRIDVMGQADIIEDLAKGTGYSTFKEKELQLPMAGIPDKLNESIQIVKDVLIGAGIQEVKSFVVTSQSNYRHTSYSGGVELLNPKSLDFSVVRDRIYLNLLEFLRINKRRQLPQKIFEVGAVLQEGKQKDMLCVMIHDSKASYSSAKQVLDLFILRMDGRKASVDEEDVEGIIPGRGGLIRLEGEKIGIIGEVDPQLIIESDLANPVSFFEIDLSKLSM